MRSENWAELDKLKNMKTETPLRSTRFMTAHGWNSRPRSGPEAMDEFNAWWESYLNKVMERLWHQ